MFPCILYFFIHPQPNNMGPVRQQPRDWGSLDFSESGRGRGHSYYLIRCATTRLHGICNGSIDKMEDEGHTLQPHSLGTGISAPPPPPKKKKTPIISEFFVWDWEGTQKCFILRDQTTGDLKSHHLQARVTLTALSMPPQPHFLSAELLCHISNLSGTVKKIKVTGILISLCSSTGSLYETTNERLVIFST